ncbi:MAG: peptidase [Thioalkalispiraceae bacterium]|jgi:putative proteasome-type protease
MTYCVAIKVNEGIVFASDSRTNAGVDYVRTYSKMHSYSWPGDRTLVILTSGNLATTQAVINKIEHDLNDDRSRFNLKQAKQLYEVAHYIGKLNQQEQAEHGKAFKENRKALGATFIVGGQIGESDDDIFLVYPEGNYITVSAETPYMQIGETKYGKPILDRIINEATSLNDAARCALVSLDSTMRSNVSVGPPLELAIYRANSLVEPTYMNIDLTSSFFKDMQTQWAEGLHNAFRNLPKFEWES